MLRAFRTQFLPFRRRPHARWPPFARRHFMIPPAPGPGASNKLGFSTYAMWGLCLVVVGVCYKLEQDDLATRPAEPDVPDEVSRVLPSGMWLMRTPLAGQPRRRTCCTATAHDPPCCAPGRGRFDQEAQLRSSPQYRAGVIETTTVRMEEIRCPLCVALATQVNEQPPYRRRGLRTHAGWASPHMTGSRIK